MASSHDIERQVLDRDATVLFCPTDQNRQLQAYESDEEEPTCYRCGQRGHVQFICRVRLDQSRIYLNSDQPLLLKRP